MKGKKRVFTRILEYLFSLTLLLMLSILLLWFVYYFDVFPLPERIVSLFSREEEVSEPPLYDESRFFLFLESTPEAKDTEAFYASLDTENAVRLIDAVTVKSGFYWETDCEIFYGEESVVYNHRMWKSSDSVRVDTVSDGYNVSVVATDESTVIQNNLTGEVRTIEGDTDFTPENMLGISDIRFFADSSESVITEARLVDAGEDKYLYVKFFTERYNKTDEFYISLDKGVVLNAYSEIGGVKTLVQSTNDFIKSKSGSALSDTAVSSEDQHQ